MSIYIVRFSDYDSEFGIGYFTSEEDAEKCMEYYMRAEPSIYAYMSDAYSLEKYELDDTDYIELLKALDEEEKEKQRKKGREGQKQGACRACQIKGKV